MNIRTLLVAAGVLALPAVASAQPVDGVYVGAGAGFNYLQSEKVKSPAGENSFTGSNGWVGLASVGYGFGNGFRAEVEGDFRSTAQKGTATKAHNSTYGVFVNGLFDIDVGSDMLFPYAGLGVGYEMQNMHNGALSDGVTTFGGTKGGVAGQAILGVAVPIAEVPGLSLTAEYRFMDTFENHTFGAVKLGSEYNHSGIIGLRYALGVAPAPMAEAPAPAPAPVVAPAPAPARTYLVFFDWDKADLTARAKQIISEAAANAAKVKLTRIEVSGHADRTGTAAYNQALSLRRANNVAAEMVRLGVPQAEISVMAFGDTHPLVPTAAGVREPQNRRVEIVLK